jgi:hypothetical protein
MNDCLLLEAIILGRKSNPLKPSGYIIYHISSHTKNLNYSHRVYLFVSCGSHNKLRFFPSVGPVAK